MGFESEIIDGNEFLLRVEKPVREEIKAHECVCLLIKEPRVTDPDVIKVMREIVAPIGIRDLVEDMVSDHDKCHQTVDNPDQPFCDDCENANHHLLPNQMGGARNIHRGNKEID